ncbi:MAG: peptide deformylase [Candidatus Omnitrophica bacterium]|nr:peptide deformylase [Candidatus Omnitrophota bacterium]
MALLKIVTYPNPILTRKSEALTQFGPAEQKLFDDMIETMYIEDGVGLAAPQIGISKRILIASPTMKEGEAIVLVNPEVYESSGSQKSPEGCLSFPGVSAEIIRAKKIRLRYQDRTGKLHDIEAKDFFARVILHELDHLNGILLIDRIDFEKRHIFLAQYQQS